MDASAPDQVSQERWPADLLLLSTMPTRISSTIHRLVLTSLLSLASGACVLSQSTDGTGLHDEQVGAIVVGTSTRADVARVFGAPDEVVYSNLEHDSLLERAYKYDRERSKTTSFTVILFSGARTDVNRDSVIVFFDEQGVVEDIAARLDMDRPRYGAPWGDDDT